MSSSESKQESLNARGSARRRMPRRSAAATTSPNRTRPRRSAAKRQDDPEASNDTSNADNTSQEPPPSAADNKQVASKPSCPHCNKSFASENGLEYHVKHRVCEKRKRKQQAEEPTQRKKRRDSASGNHGRDSVEEGEEEQQQDSSSEPDKKKVSSESKGGTCPHCDKSFRSDGGFEYHVNHRVCQKQNKSPARLKRKEKDSQANNDCDSRDDSSDNSESGQKEEGKEDSSYSATEEKAPSSESQRTCPHCSKSFTSAFGLAYHVKNRVCMKEKESRKVSDDDEIEESAEPRKKKSKSTRSRKGPDSERTCPACQRVFTSHDGLAYHVKHKVCERKPQRAGPARNKVPVTKKDRTCPHCNRVFSVMLGIQYHLKHQVCLRGTRARSGVLLESSFETLAEGSKFATNFGIVQVVVDNRESPNAPYQPPSDIKALVKKRNANISKLETKRKTKHKSLAIRSRMRRERLWKLYATEKHQQQEEIWNAYYGRDPNDLSEAQRKMRLPTKKETGEDPLFPKALCPDRVVECILIPDERRVVVKKQADHDVEEETSQGEPPVAAANTTGDSAPYCGMRLFLKRRDLVTPYNPDADVFVCRDCGGKFNSKDGMTYHEQSGVCTNKSKDRAEQRQHQIVVVDKAVKERLQQEAKFKDKLEEANNSRRHSGVPREVMEELGIRDKEQLKRAKNDGTDEEEFVVGPDLEHPDKVLEDLQAELDKCNAILEKPLPGAGKVPKKKKRRRKKINPVLTPYSTTILPMIDTMVLADEVDAGRYPSMQRFHGEHEMVCFICKQETSIGKEQPYGCAFCAKTEHMQCLLTKYTVKAPEPGEDFMCHSCIQAISHRRARAEKRRQKKHSATYMVDIGNDDNGEETCQSETAAVASIEEEDGIDDSNEDNEYYIMARKAREVSELMELLGDAQQRLLQATDTSKVNQLRRSLIESGAVLTDPQGTTVENGE